MSTYKDRKNSEKDPLREHYLSEKLTKNGKPLGYLTIKGYVGKSDSTDMVRLYLNKEFSSYLDIKKIDILHAEEITSEELEFGGTCIWVKKDAELNRVSTESIKQQAQFMEGDIAKAQLRPENLATGLGRMGGVNSSVGINCPSLWSPICVSDDNPCTWAFDCQVFSARTPECWPQSTKLEGCYPSIRPIDCPTPRCDTIRAPRCGTIVISRTICDPDPDPDLTIELKAQIEKLKRRIKKLEEGEV